MTGLRRIGKKILEAGLTDTAQYVLIAAPIRQGSVRASRRAVTERHLAGANPNGIPGGLAGTYARMGKRMRRGRFSGGLQGLPPTQFVSPSLSLRSTVLSDKDHASNGWRKG